MPATFKLPRRLYLTADGKHVVEEGDSRAASLLGPEGEEIPLARAVELGLATMTGEPVKAEEPEVKERVPAETKVRTPQSTKRAKAPVKKK